MHSVTRSTHHLLVKAACHLRQCKHHSKFAGGLCGVLKIQPQMISEFNELDFTQVLGVTTSNYMLYRACTRVRY
jgi:hypothetical protein